MAILSESKRKAEDVLKESEERFRLVIENSIDLIALLDANGTYEYISPSHERILGYKSADLIGKKLGAIIHPDDLPQIIKDGKKSAQGKLATNLEFRLLHKNGTWITAEGSAQAVLDRTGKPVKIIAIARDITHRKRTESNTKFLAEASKVFSSSLDLNKTFNNIVEYSSSYIAEWCIIDSINVQGEIEMVAIANQDEEKMKLGVEFRNLFPRSFRGSYGVWKAIDLGKPYIFTKKDFHMFEKNVKKLGHEKLIQKLHIIAALYIPLEVHGKILGSLTFASSKDGSVFTHKDTVFIEEVAKRAAMAIENATLYTQAQQAIELRDDFIAMASHELKTPLTSIKLFIQLIKKEFVNNPQAEEAIGKVTNQVNRLIALVSDMLDTTKIHKGKLYLKNEHFILKQFISEIVEDMQQITHQHQLIFKQQANGFIYSDKERLRQVFINLINNAITYSLSGGDIIIRSQKKSGFIVVSVQDFGIGIPQEEQQQIFERFYKAEKHKTYPGLGVGLYITKDIISSMGGKIWVKSKNGKGSTFYFSLPLRRV